MTDAELERLGSEIFDMLPDDPDAALQIILWLTSSVIAWTAVDPELFVANLRKTVSAAIKETCQ